MADESDNKKGGDSQSGGGLTVTPDQRLNAIGETVRGYVQQVKGYIFSSPDGSKPALNKLEEGVIAATTGWKVPGVNNAEMYALPFVSKNLFRVNWESEKTILGDRQLQGQISLGSSQPTLNQFSLTKERMKDGSHTFEEVGLLDQRTPKGASYLGKADPKGPLLNNLGIGVGNAGGVGARGRIADSTLAMDVQLAHNYDVAALPVPRVTAPTKLLTVTHSGAFDLAEGNGKGGYAVGATVFSGLTGPGIQDKINKTGVDVTGQLQHRNGPNTSNLTAEVMAVGDAGNMKRAALEVSRQIKGGLTPYFEVSTTHARGAAIPDGMLQGKSTDAKAGVAYTMVKDGGDGRALDFYCEVADGSRVKPSLTCGFSSGAVGANVMQTGKRK